MGSSKSTIIVLALAAIVLAALIALDIFRMRARNAETQAILAEVAGAEDRKASLQAVRAMREKFGAEIAYIEKIAMTESRLVSMIEDIESAGRSLGPSVRIISVDKEGEEGSELVRVTVEARGSWAQTLTFLKALESLPYKASYERAALAKEGSTWRGSFVITAPIFGQ